MAGLGMGGDDAKGVGAKKCRGEKFFAPAAPWQGVMRWMTIAGTRVFPDGFAAFFVYGR